jgi:hypothetical protein
MQLKESFANWSSLDTTINQVQKFVAKSKTYNGM